MLVLSRKAGEALMIGDEVKVTIKSIIGNRVSLAFEAPDSVRINRKEVYDAIQKKRLTDQDE